MDEFRELCPACLLPSLAQGHPSWGFLLLKETEKPEVPAGSWATNAGGTLASLIFRDYFTIAKPPATHGHWLESKKAQVWIVSMCACVHVCVRVCVCSNTSNSV